MSLKLPTLWALWVRSPKHWGRNIRLARKHWKALGGSFRFEVVMLFQFLIPNSEHRFIHMELNNCLNLQHKFSFWCDTKIITQLVGNSETSDSGRKSNFGLDEKCFVINKRKKNLHTERDVGSIAIKFQTLIVLCETPKCADVFRTCFLKFIFPSHIQKLCQICPSL